MAYGGIFGAAARRIQADDWSEAAVSSRVGDARPRDHRRPWRWPSLCPELECVRHLLPQRILAAAERRAKSIGVGADRALICADAITEEAYLAALAASLGTSFEPLDGVARADCLLDDEQFLRAPAVGLLPLRQGGKTIWIVAARHLTARHLADPYASQRHKPQSFRLTSSERLLRFVMRHAQDAVGRSATESLRRDHPHLSNAAPPRARRNLPGMMLALLAVGALTFLAAAKVEAFAIVLSTAFLATAGLRLSSAFYADNTRKSSRRIGDDKLPIYTIICALYREEKVVGDLVAAIRALDYPAEKLDVKFILEPDDQATKRAVARLALGPPFEIITAPPIGPRTKPKALNVALLMARGAYTVVYDAEDIPEPDQLRRAVALFKANDDRLACVQASLTIDNTADNWITRMFTANYAGHFDVFLAGLAALRLPFPLGGSSNHFRTSVLRKIGAWDPYNVTEDADLGIRLYRLGYWTAALASATFEEAPVRFWPWLKQRTRWYKGWMQTWLVHMRHPQRLVRELTPAGAIAFQLFLTCNVFAALIHPFFMIALGYCLLSQPPLRAMAAVGPDSALFVATFLGGYASAIALDLIGLRRRGLLAHGWVLMLTPLYWLMLSLAAWRALYQLVCDPHGWEKTEHGLAKSSRMADAGPRKSPNSDSPIAPKRIMERAAGSLIASGHERFLLHRAPTDRTNARTRKRQR